MIKPLTDLTASDLSGKRVLLRLDLNVPIENGQITDDFRIVKNLPTIQWLVGKGSRVVIIAHLGQADASLQPVAEYLQKSFPVIFAKTIEEAAATTGEQVVLLENLRQWEGEESNSAEFARELATLGEIYVNDAFSASHREHASIVGVPTLLPSYAGPVFRQEIQHLSALFTPTQPLLVIIGGAKFSTKLPLVERFLPLAEHIVIAGALAHPLYRALGYEIGHSLIDEQENTPEIAALAPNPKVIVPQEVVVKTGAGDMVTRAAGVVEPGDTILDAAPATLTDLAGFIAEAKTILWNGPVGNYEHGYTAGTEALAKLIAGSGAETVVGGGDTIAAIAKLGLFNKFTFVSTAGGAMLDYLATGTLPGIEALR